MQPALTLDQPQFAQVCSLELEQIEGPPNALCNELLGAPLGNRAPHKENDDRANDRTDESRALAR